MLKLPRLHALRVCTCFARWQRRAADVVCDQPHRQFVFTNVCVPIFSIIVPFFLIFQIWSLT
jgi:hypothetical protein